MTLAAGALTLLPAATAAAEDHARLKRELSGAMRQATRASGAYVYDLSDRTRLYARRATKRRILASNTKLFTTAAALDRFGSDGTFTTEVLASRRPNADGVVRGDLYLRGGGDPTFGTDSFAERAYGGGGATVETLAREVKEAGVRRVTGRIYGDESLFDSLRGGPDSGYGTSPWVGPLSALAFNRGLAREEGTSFQRRPPEFAAKRLTGALKRIGVRVAGKAAARPAGSNTRAVTSLESIALSRIVRITNNISDNFFAELLAKHLDARPGHPGTTAGGAAAVMSFAARRFRANARLVDGSGLARGNMAAPRGVVKLLRGMRRHDEFRTYYNSLAVAGSYGTLQDRRTNRRCRAKTGTISGVSALSGYCRAASGDMVAFSFLMNGVGYNYDRARRIQDAMTQLIAKHG